MIGNLIKAVFGIAGAMLPLIVGVWACEWWEHRPAGQPAWAHVHFLWIKWMPPESLAAQRDAYKIEYVQAKANVIVLTRAVGVQSAAIRANAAAGVRALATSENAVQRYRSLAATTLAHVRIVSAPLVGDTMCERVRDADLKFTGTL